MQEVGEPPKYSFFESPFGIYADILAVPTQRPINRSNWLVMGGSYSFHLYCMRAMASSVSFAYRFIGLRCWSMSSKR